MMQEFYDLVKKIEGEKQALEVMLETSLDSLRKRGLNTDKFEDSISYYRSFSGDTEEANHYAYIKMMINSHTIEDMVIKKHKNFKVWNFKKLQKLITDWVDSLSIKEEMTDQEIEKAISEAKDYFLNVLEDYKLTNTDNRSFIADFNDNIQLITKKKRQEYREHGERVLDKAWIISR